MGPGIPFGRYRLVRRIARGGMAEVFLAWQAASSRQEEIPDGDGFYDVTTGIRFQRQVAVKRILPHLSESDEFRALFLQEARLAATLSHPNVVHIYEFGKIGESLFLAMELIEGVGLSTVIRRFAPREGAAGPRLPIEHAVRIIADVLAGLHHAHTRTDGAGRPQHIVHRDMSPQNIMITMDGVVKILDFGIAKAAWSEKETRPGVIRGKYAYMSPEQAEGQKLDGRSDVFAVGVCLFELLTGTALVPRDLPLEAALRMVRTGGAIAGLGQLEILRPDVPEDLAAVLRRALMVRREHRYPSAGEMQLDLERFLKGWPRLSSPLLLGEFLRGHGLGSALGRGGEEHTGLATPVIEGPEAIEGEDGAEPTGERPVSRARTPPKESGADTVVDPDPAGSRSQDTAPRSLHLEAGEGGWEPTMQEGRGGRSSPGAEPATVLTNMPLGTLDGQGDATRRRRLPSRRVADPIETASIPRWRLLSAPRWIGSTARVIALGAFVLLIILLVMRGCV